MQCDRCQKEIVVPEDSFTTGYGRTDDGEKYCYDCCADTDKAYMREHGKITLYLQEREITNWPGTLHIPVTNIRKGRHNLARTRYDVWFRFEGQWWHGVQYGDNTQLVHCKRIKS